MKIRPRKDMNKVAGRIEQTISELLAAIGAFTSDVHIVQLIKVYDDHLPADMKLPDWLTEQEQRLDALLVPLPAAVRAMVDQCVNDSCKGMYKGVHSSLQGLVQPAEQIVIIICKAVALERYGENAISSAEYQRFVTFFVRAFPSTRGRLLPTD